MNFIRYRVVDNFRQSICYYIIAELLIYKRWLSRFHVCELNLPKEAAKCFLV